MLPVRTIDGTSRATLKIVRAVTFLKIIFGAILNILRYFIIYREFRTSLSLCRRWYLNYSIYRARQHVNKLVMGLCAGDQHLTCTVSAASISDQYLARTVRASNVNYLLFTWSRLCTSYGCVLVTAVYQLRTCTSYGYVPVTAMHQLWLQVQACTFKATSRAFQYIQCNSIPVKRPCTCTVVQVICYQVHCM